MLGPHEDEDAAEWTTASQLAEMGFCERKLVLKHLYGSRTSAARRRAQSIGTGEHRRFLLSAFNERPSVISSITRHRRANTKVDASLLRCILQLLRLSLRKCALRCTRNKS
jgi:hypothetical protein